MVKVLVIGADAKSWNVIEPWVREGKLTYHQKTYGEWCLGKSTDLAYTIIHPQHGNATPQAKIQENLVHVAGGNLTKLEKNSHLFLPGPSKARSCGTSLENMVINVEF